MGFNGVVDAQLELRNANLLLRLQVDDAGHRAQSLFELGGKCAQGVVVVAIDFECDLRAHARQHMVESMGNGLPHDDACGQRRQALADVREHLLAAAG
jgi:hypothetical protein